MTACLALLLAVLAPASLAGAQPRPVGGVPSEYGQFPEVVSVQTSPTIGASEHLCGGIIVNDNHVLTLASCVAGYGSLGLQVMAAGINLEGIEGIEEFRNIRDIIIHDSYNVSSKENDLAILKTNDNFVFVTGLVLPAVLPVNGTLEPALDTLFNIPGWGRTSYEGPQPVNQTYVDMTYLPRADCQVIYGDSIKGTQGCITNFSNKGVCSGDEGSPMVSADGTSMGLVAWHVGCDAYPAAVTLLESYYPWIISKFDT